MRSDARGFAHDSGVEVRDQTRSRAHALAGESEKAVGRCSAPLRVARRKVRSDIAVGERAEERVDQRMKHDVGVGMSGIARANAGCGRLRA